jgi:hypothetical protein
MKRDNNIRHTAFLILFWILDATLHISQSPSRRSLDKKFSLTKSYPEVHIVGASSDHTEQEEQEHNKARADLGFYTGGIVCDLERFDDIFFEVTTHRVRR